MVLPIGSLAVIWERPIPLNDDDLAVLYQLSRQSQKPKNHGILNHRCHWRIPMDLSVKNPNLPEEAPLRSPSRNFSPKWNSWMRNQYLVAIYKRIGMNLNWIYKKIGDVCWLKGVVHQVHIKIFNGF